MYPKGTVGIFVLFIPLYESKLILKAKKGKQVPWSEY